MPRPEHIAALTPITRSRLVADLQRLGVRSGAIAMVHASLSSLGWVVGGSQTVVEALLTCLGPDGTLCAQASWEDIPFGHATWPEEWRTAYEEFPPFDPQLSAAAPYEGRLAERIRTWPGAHRSANPATGITAIGARAAALTAAHRLDDGFGPGTPYARIVAAGGQVVLVGAPLRTISLLHHAESIARAPKRWTTYRLPLRTGWAAIRELDVWNGVYPDAPLDAIAKAALAAGVGRCGSVGASTSHVFEAAELTRFAVAWLERRCGASAAPSG